MKKSSAIVAVTVVIITVLGIFYIGNSYNLKKHESGYSRVENSDSEEKTQRVSEDNTLGEYEYTLSNNEIVTAKYIKTEGSVRIYSLYPINNKSKYNISQSGSLVVYVGNDGHIWALYNDGTSKRITPDRYDSIEKSLIQKENPSYIWAGEPEVTYTGSVRFISNLPDSSPSPKKSIWEISPESGVMRKLYTILSDSYRLLGYRDDGRLLVLDNDSIAALDLVDTSVSDIDVKNKNIIGMSPDGTRILFVKKDSSNKPDFSKQYIMDSYGNNISLLPGIEGYTPTPMGAWGYESSSYDLRYAFIIKANSGGRDKVAVINFVKGFVGINSYTPDINLKLSNDSKLKWSADDLISIDTGEDIITVELK